MTLSPFINHWWHSALYVSPHGLTTSPIPYKELRYFEIEFNFINQLLEIRTSDGAYRAMSLTPKSVALFYTELMTLLASLDIHIKIDLNPKEVINPIQFNLDQYHASYDANYALRFWKILLQTDRVFMKVRGKFIGKSSPVHFFWGSCDLALSRFSGRRAPNRPEADNITRLAYSHEVISFGFWPGSGDVLKPAFYAYAAPEPEGFSNSSVQPSTAFYNASTKGFILLYDEVKNAPDPDQMILDFCESTFKAASRLAKWDQLDLGQVEKVGTKSANKLRSA
jgi:hypothetical protein